MGGGAEFQFRVIEFCFTEGIKWNSVLRVKIDFTWGGGKIKQNLVFEGKEDSVLSPPPLSKTEFRFGVKHNALMQKYVKH